MTWAMAPFDQQRRSFPSEHRRTASVRYVQIVPREPLGDLSLLPVNKSDGSKDDGDAKLLEPPASPSPALTFSQASPTSTTAAGTQTSPQATDISSSTLAPGPAQPSTSPTILWMPGATSLMTTNPTSVLTPTISIMSTTPAALSSAPTSTPGNKGVNAGVDGEDDTKTSAAAYAYATTSSSSTSAHASTSVVALPVSVPTVDTEMLPFSDVGQHQSLSPTTQHALIALGAIAAAFIFGFAIWFTLRLMKVDVKAKFQQAARDKWSRKRPFGGRLFNRRATFSQSFEALSDEKAIPSQRKLDDFFSPIAMTTKAPLVSAVALSRGTPQRQESVREALQYHSDSNQLDESYPPQPPPKAYYPTQTPVRQPSFMYNQRVSDLSSLSSGFGDAKIDVPESGPSTMNTQRISLVPAEPINPQGPNPRFSWMTAHTPTTPRTIINKDNRDTMFTTASVESSPRFRTVNSWVNQQTTRVQRQQQSDREVENMPELPVSSRRIVPTRHRRLPSGATDPAFAHHPGDEVVVERGSRVPSVILDRKFGQL